MFRTWHIRFAPDVVAPSSLLCLDWLRQFNTAPFPTVLFLHLYFDIFFKIPTQKKLQDHFLRGDLLVFFFNYLKYKNK